LALTPDTGLGVYEVTAPIGEGGILNFFDELRRRVPLEK
jgi:hypothetical protein